MHADVPSPATLARSGVISRSEAHVREAFARRPASSRYSWFDRAHLYAMQEVERGMLRHLAAHGLESLRGVDVLDVGCGSAVWLREFIKWGAEPRRLTGIDLLQERVDDARELVPAGVRIVCGRAAALECEAASFDVVLQTLVFTSILEPDVRSVIAGEMCRVLRPGGLLLWYDYHVSNPKNPDVRGVTRSELLRLFPDCRIEISRVTLAPPLARVVAPRSTLVYQVLCRVPFLTTHYLAAIHRH
jgi:ubiquinone/menaquinone biosynthesis C-methylase UbiE